MYITGILIGGPLFPPSESSCLGKSASQDVPKLRFVFPAPREADRGGTCSLRSFFAAGDTDNTLRDNCPRNIFLSLFSSPLPRNHAVELPPPPVTPFTQVNSYNLLSNAVPFGGMRQSGMGRELGLAGIKEYLGQSLCRPFPFVPDGFFAASILWAVADPRLSSFFFFSFRLFAPPSCPDLISVRPSCLCTVLSLSPLPCCTGDAGPFLPSSQNKTQPKPKKKKKKTAVKSIHHNLGEDL